MSAGLPDAAAQAGPGSRRPRDGVRALRVLEVATAVGGLAQSLAGAVGALLAAQVAGSEAVAGLPQAALVAGSAVAALALSGLAARRGRRASLASGAGVAVGGRALVVVAACVGSLAGVLVGSLLLGAGNTAVMLARYAAADLAPSTSRARAMASVLVATTVGAVLGPNLLAPADHLGTRLGMPGLAGPYLLAGVAFTAAALTLLRGLPAQGHPPTGTAPDTALGAVIQDPPSRLGGDGVAGLVVLALANLVMVAVMTMAPVQLHHLGHGLPAIGTVISAHIAAMFAPSPASGWLTDHLGPRRAAATAGALLVTASATAAAGAGSLPVLTAAMVLLGSGWNLALVSGSVLLTTDVHPLQRPRREGWGEVSMGLAAAGGGIAAGPLVTSGGYPTLAVAGALTAALLLPATLAST